MCVCVCVCMRYMRTFKQILSLNLSRSLSLNMYIYVCMCVYIYIYMCVCVCVCVCVSHLLNAMSAYKYRRHEMLLTWTATDRFSIVWKSDLSNKIKRYFFQAAAVSVLLYGCTTWTLTKSRCEQHKNVRAVWNKSRKQHPKNNTYTPSHKQSK